MAIVWASPWSVERYAAAGRGVWAPRRSCPGCGRAMIFWSGYQRFVRDAGTVRIWVRRAKCTRCRPGVSHALLPSFVLPRRFDAVGVIGGALTRMATGASPGTVAAGVGVPAATVRDWRWRYRARAPTLAAGFAAASVALGGDAPVASGPPEVAALEALGAAWAAARARLGGRCPGVWGFAATVTGGGLLATTTAPSWTALDSGRLLPPVPV